MLITVLFYFFYPALKPDLRKKKSLFHKCYTNIRFVSHGIWFYAHMISDSEAVFYQCMWKAHCRCRFQNLLISVNPVWNLADAIFESSHIVFKCDLVLLCVCVCGGGGGGGGGVRPQGIRGCGFHNNILRIPQQEPWQNTELTIDTTYLTLTCELWGVFCEFFWLRFIKSAINVWSSGNFRRLFGGESEVEILYVSYPDGLS